MPAGRLIALHLAAIRPAPERIGPDPDQSRRRSYGQPWVVGAAWVVRQAPAVPAARHPVSS